MKTRLIASAPSAEKLLEMIAQYFYGKPENYRIGNTGLLYSKKPNGTERLLESFLVIKKKDRYRFERIMAQEEENRNE